MTKPGPYLFYVYKPIHATITEKQQQQQEENEEKKAYPTYAATEELTQTQSQAGAESMRLNMYIHTYYI